MENSRYIVPPDIRKSLLNKSRSNRMFFDSLCREIWCQCRRGGCRTTTPDEWIDTLHPHYGTAHGALFDPSDETGCWNTPRRVLSKKEIECIQRFILTHEFRDIVDACRQISKDLFNDCVATALNSVPPPQPIWDELRGIYEKEKKIER